MEVQLYQDFTAQGFNVKALMLLYSDLEKNEEKKPNLTPIVVFLAFSVESYINSVGARALNIWDEIERLPWRTKLEILHKSADKIPNWGIEPLQFAIEIFKLRDKLAHGKPERVISPKGDGVVDFSKLVPEWYKMITKQWVVDAKGRFHALMVYIANLYEFHESDHLTLSTGGELANAPQNG